MDERKNAGKPELPNVPGAILSALRRTYGGWQRNHEQLAKSKNSIFISKDSFRFSLQHIYGQM